MSWPEPEGGWLEINDIGDVLSDDEIRALGFEPTTRGWRPIEQPKSEPQPEPDPELIEGLREALRKRQYG